MEQLVILLLIALISIINWVVQKSKERREARKLQKRADRTGEGVKGGLPEPPATPSETAMRRLKEALGLPEEAAPPPLPRPTPVPSPPRPAPPLPPPLPIPEVAPKPLVSHPPVTPLHRFPELHQRTGKRSVPIGQPAKSSRIRELLSSADGLRDAVVLSEILGPPKGLRGR